MPITSDYIKLATDLLTLFLEEIKSDLLYLLDSENRNATGRARKSLNVVVENLKGGIEGTDYMLYTLKGRGPGRMPPLSAIIDWCNVRGLPRGVAWVIAKRIAEFGTKLYQQKVNYIDLVLDQKRIDTFVELLKDDFVVTIKQDLKVF